jgi:cell division protein FtsB
MDQRVTTEQLIYKIGALTLENDILRAQVERLQQQIAELAKPEEKTKSNAPASFGSISD